MAVKNRTALNVVAVAILLVAWTAFYRIHHPRPPRIDRRPHEALGEVLAEETTRHLRPGARLIVIARDAAAFEVPAAEAQVDAFLRAIRKAGRRVDERRSIRLDPLRLAAVPPGDFFDLLRLGRAGDVIVSFLGPPVLEPAQLTALPPRRPLVLAVCSPNAPAQVNLRELFERGLLQAVVLSRPDAPAHAAPGSRQSAFAQRFQLVTAANLHDLPASVGPRLR